MAGRPGQSKRKFKMSAHESAQRKVRLEREAAGLDIYTGKPVDFSEQGQAVQEAAGHTKPVDVPASDVKPSVKATSDEKWAGVTGLPAKNADLQAMPLDRLQQVNTGNVLNKAQKARAQREIARRAQLQKRPVATQSPSSTAASSQDQRKAAGARADASTPQVAPSASSSGKQAADPSIAKHSGTTNQTGTKKKASVQSKAKSTPDTTKGPRKLSMSPKQVARRKARGFPNGR